MPVHSRAHWVFIAAAALTLLASVPGFSGPRDSGGGAGERKDGKLMSFYSSGLYVEPEPAGGPDKIQGLPELLEFVNHADFWTSQSRAALVSMAAPSDRHRYYRVKEDAFDRKTRRAILNKFSEVTRKPIRDLRLFAITDKDSGITYLLPGFDELSLEDKMGALFHETYWLLFPSSDYETVVNAEMAFRAVVDQPMNTARILNLLDYYGDLTAKVQATVKGDLATGAMNGLVNKDNTIDLAKIYGKEAIACISSHNGNSFDPAACDQIIANHLYTLKTRDYPNSYFIDFLYRAQTDKAAFAVYWQGVWNGSELGASLGELGRSNGGSDPSPGIDQNIMGNCRIKLLHTSLISDSNTVRLETSHCESIEDDLREEFKGTNAAPQGQLILDLYAFSGRWGGNGPFWDF